MGGRSSARRLCRTPVDGRKWGFRSGFDEDSAAPARGNPTDTGSVEAINMIVENRKSGRAALLWLLTLAATAASADSSRVRTDHVDATLVSEVAQVAPNESFWIGLRFSIKPGWHTYWRNPGDSGLAANIDWQLPEGMVAGEIRWPIPNRFATGHLMNYGYADEVVLLTRMTAWPPIGTQADVVIAANARWLVCEDVCIMEEGRFETRLPAAVGASVHDPEARALIHQYTRMLPESTESQARFDVTSTDIRLRVPLPSDLPRGATDIWFYPQEFGVIDHAAPQKAESGPAELELTLARGELGQQSLDRLRGVLVLRFADGTARGVSVDAFPS